MIDCCFAIGGVDELGRAIKPGAAMILLSMIADRAYTPGLKLQPSVLGFATTVSGKARQIPASHALTIMR